MPNGKLGDHPLTDMLFCEAHPFPADMEALLREILAIDPGFPDSNKRKYLDQLVWDKRFFDWQAGMNLDEGRRALQAALAEISGRPGKGLK